MGWVGFDIKKKAGKQRIEEKNRLGVDCRKSVRTNRDFDLGFFFIQVDCGSKMMRTSNFTA